MNKPIAVFDTGLGSYSIVEAIHKAYPKQDIIYFADRKNFPYGNKNINELCKIIEDTVIFLKYKGANFIVLASNSPSITVLDKIKNKDGIMGIYPPLKNVIRDKKKNTLILGAKVMTESQELKDYIKRETLEKSSQFHIENASSLIELIENGSFINKQKETEKFIRNFIQKCQAKYGEIDSITLSSTHLAWLTEYFKKIAPEITLYDPAAELIKNLEKYTSDGSGKIYAIISENEKFLADDFLKILKDLNIKIEYEIIK